MKHLDIKKQSLIDAKVSHSLLVQLVKIFGNDIPINQEVEVNVANLAHMASEIKDYANLKVMLVNMMCGDSATFGEELKLTGAELDIFKLGISTALDLVGTGHHTSPNEIDLLDEMDKIS